MTRVGATSTCTSTSKVSLRMQDTICDDAACISAWPLVLYYCYCIGTYLVAIAEGFEFRDTADGCFLIPGARVPIAHRHNREHSSGLIAIPPGAAWATRASPLPMVSSGGGTCGRQASGSAEVPRESSGVSGCSASASGRASCGREGRPKPPFFTHGPWELRWMRTSWARILSDID